MDQVTRARTKCDGSIFKARADSVGTDVPTARYGSVQGRDVDIWVAEEASQYWLTTDEGAVR